MLQDDQSATCQGRQPLVQQQQWRQSGRYRHCTYIHESLGSFSSWMGESCQLRLMSIHVIKRCPEGAAKDCTPVGDGRCIIRGPSI